MEGSQKIFLQAHFKADSLKKINYFIFVGCLMALSASRLCSADW
jgi:hypothetical protein